MIISRSEWKMIQVFNGVDSIEPRNLAKSFADFDELKLKKTLKSLTDQRIVNYFWISSGYSSYNLTHIGMKIARRGFLKHNAIEVFAYIDKHKAWIPIIVGIIGLAIVIRKC